MAKKRVARSITPWVDELKKLEEQGLLKCPEKRYLYFAYGSNLNREQMAYRCPTAHPLHRAKLYGASMIFKHYADVELDRKNHKWPVWGAVYEITKNDMDALDYYEGYPTFYRKVKVQVMLENGNVEEVFMYVMNKRVREVELPTNEYFDCIAKGYQDWNMNMNSLFTAWERTALKLGVYEGEEKKARL